MEDPEKKLKPLFTSGNDQKRTLGNSLWNLDGMKYFHRAEKRWRQVYDNEKDMRVLYNGWERWITTTGAGIRWIKKHSRHLWDHGVKMFQKL